MLRSKSNELSVLVSEAKTAIIQQATISLALESLIANNGDRGAAANQLAVRLAASWKPASALRCLGGLIRYANWARGASKAS